MGIVPDMLVGGVNIGCLVCIGVNGFRELVLEYTGAYFLDDTRNLRVNSVGCPVGVLLVLESIGVVSLDCQPLGRSDGHVEGVADVIY